MRLPRYPVYIPSKGRADVGTTARRLVRDGVPFKLVIETPEIEAYAKHFGYDVLLTLPFRNRGLTAARNWIKDHATASGAERHWQLDDNMHGCYAYRHAERIPCRYGVALAAVEDFSDRYENVAVSGLNYSSFAIPFRDIPPFQRNSHVYSCSLILNATPFRWRPQLNDDTDLCLQVLAAGWCTVLFNAFTVQKSRTMVVKGGNTTIYQGDGRLRMARSLIKDWPRVVRLGRRFQRPQHIVRHAWLHFDTPLKLKPGLDLSTLPPVDNYGLVEVGKVRHRDDDAR